MKSVLVHQTNDSPRMMHIASTQQPDNSEFIVTYSFVFLYLYLTLLLCFLVLYRRHTSSNCRCATARHTSSNRERAAASETKSKDENGTSNDGIRKSRQVYYCSWGGRKFRQRVYGYVMEARENNKYLVRFDNSTEN